MTRQHWLAAAGIIGLATLLAFTGVFNPNLPTHAQSDQPGSIMTVSAHGEIAADPDTGQIEIGVQTQERTAQQAIEANARKMTAVVDALSGLGIDERDIQTSRFSVAPVYERRDREEDLLVGFQAENRVRVIVRDIEKLGEIIDRTTRAGANRIHNINFLISDRQDLEDQALRLAIKNARRQADVAADESGVRIVGIKKIDIVSDAAPVPYARADMAESAATPVMPGQVDLRVRVNVTFDISR